MNNTDFSSLPLPESMLTSLQNLGFSTMTPVQAQSLPHILNKLDVIAQAKTGSGKTAAFAIGILTNLDPDRCEVQSLVLCPTRELADQVAKVIRSIARFTENIKVLTLCGGSPYKPQADSLSHGAHIIVGTPGRVLNHLENNTFTMNTLTTLVIDEAHRMFDMGFIESIKKVIAFTPKQRQTLLFSATYPEDVLELSAAVQTNAVSIRTIGTEKANDISEYFYAVAPEDKDAAIIRLLGHFKPENVIVFANTKQQCKDITQNLIKNNINALAIHGDLEQYERTDVLVRFINRSCSVMVATDVAARGLDIEELAMVINHEVPFNTSIYTHRIGRTGRAGKVGCACTLYSERQEFRADGYRNNQRLFEDINTLAEPEKVTMQPKNMTLVIEGGKKQKLRPGDILGALTGDAGIDGALIGQISIYEKQSYVAIERHIFGTAYGSIKKCKIKGRKFPVWILQ